MSVNLELPTAEGLKLLAPHKRPGRIFYADAPLYKMEWKRIKKELVLYRNAPRFVPAGQSTQMIIGATPETDDSGSCR